MKYMECLCKPVSSPEEIQSLFDSWCLTQDYIERLSLYEKDYLSDGHALEVKALKNIFHCEAHNELVKNTLMMIFESRVEAARPGVEIIKRLQEMEVEV